MEIPKIDESKLPAVMKLIDDAARLMEETGCCFDENAVEARKELESYQGQLVEITGNKNLDIESFMEYWTYTDLETAATKALLPSPAKTGLSDEQISEMISAVYNDKFDDEASMDYLLEVLEVETGLDDFSDYIYYPENVGLDPNPELNEIIARVLSDRK